MPKKSKSIRFVPDPDAGPPPMGYIRLTTSLPFFEDTVQIALDVPDGRMGLADIMPAAWAISEHLTDLTVARVIDRGETIPCAKGCKACCRAYLVTCSPPEAFRLLDDIQSLRTSERQRCLAALQASAEQYARSGVTEACASEDIPADQREQAVSNLTAAFWRKTCFDCPILRDGACSLYGSRPTACREFLVTSPPELCAEYKPTRVPLPFSMGMTLSIWAGRIEELKPSLIPVVNVLAWFANKSARATRTWRAPAIVQTFLDVLTKRATTAHKGE